MDPVVFDSLESELSNASYWKVHKAIALKFGLSTAVWLAELRAWQQYLIRQGLIDYDEPFYCSQTELTKRVDLSAWTQTAIIKKLTEVGVIEVEARGLPRRNYYTFNRQVYGDLIKEYELAVRKKVIEGNSSEGEVTSCENPAGNPEKISGLSQRNSQPIIINKIIMNEEEETSFFSNEKKNGPAGRSLDSLSSDSDKHPPKLKRRTKAEKMKQNRAQLLPLKPNPKPVSIPSTVQGLLSYWESLGLKLPAKTTRSFAKTVQALKWLRTGRLFTDRAGFEAFWDRSFSTEEIKQAMKNFSLAATDPNYEPQEGTYKQYLRKIRLSEFLFNPFSRNGSKSFFISYLEPPKTVKEALKRIPDEHPQVTTQIRNWWKENICGSLSVKPTPKQENDFRKASVRLMEFFEENKGNLWLTELVQSPELEMVRMLGECILESVNGDTKKITTGFFCSDLTFGERFPSYLFSQGVAKPEEKVCYGLPVFKGKEIVGYR